MMSKQIKLTKTLRNVGLSILTTASAVALACNSTSAISIGVSPPRFELKLDQRRSSTQSFQVVNNGKKPSTFRIYTQDWTLDEKNNIKAVPTSEQSLSSSIVVNPVRFTIPPGKAQSVRFSVRPRVQPKSGEHRAFIFIEEVPSEDRDASPKSVADVRVVGRFGVAVYGYVGEIKRVASLNKITVDTKTGPVQANFDISSQGNGYVRMAGQYAIWPAAKYPGANATKQIANLEKKTTKLPENVLSAGFLPRSPILPDTRRQIPLRIPQKLTPGQYVLDINGELNGIKIDQGIPFSVSVLASTPRKPLTSPADSSRRNIIPRRTR